jgi:CRP-like cAMP-binding protein
LLELNGAEPIRKSYPKGAVFLNTETSPTQLIGVVSGVVKIEGQEGQGSYAMVLYPGEMFGGRNVFESLSSKLRAVALTDVTICIHDETKLLNTLQSNKEALEQYLKVVSKQVAIRQEDAIRCKVCPVKVRLMQFLHKDLMARGKPNSNNHLVIDLLLQQDTLGLLLGARRETISRAIKEIRDENLMVIEGKIVVLLDKPKVEQILADFHCL